MNPGIRLCFLGGCVLVAALVSPHSARVASEDLLGPYACPSAEGSGLDLANAVSVEVPLVHEDSSGDVHRDADSEIAHDAP